MLKSFKKLLTESIKNLIDFINKNHNDHLGKTIYDVHHTMHELQGSDNKPHSPKLEPHELKALQSYTEESNHINTGLIDNDGDIHKAESRHADNTGEEINLEHLDSGIAKHTLPKMTVHSGVNFNPGEITKKTKGVFKTSAYTSTSVHPGDAQFFARPQYKNEDEWDRHILNIHVPQGHAGIYLGNRKDGSKMTGTDEHEVLLPRGLTYKINSKPTIIKDQNKDNIHIWDAHIVPNGVNPHEWEPK